LYFSFAVERTAKEKFSAYANTESINEVLLCASIKIPKDADFCFPASQRKAKNKNVLCVLGVFAVNMSINCPPFRGIIKPPLLGVVFDFSSCQIKIEHSPPQRFLFKEDSIPQIFNLQS
jgi:hypothetical protein